uniref:Uncharacterized protein n=1 Tax=Rhizophora mucronata TaxID=61149 RepID=A0A2P2NXQ5_RHIMU
MYGNLYVVQLTKLCCHVKYWEASWWTPVISVLGFLGRKRSF